MSEQAMETVKGSENAPAPEMAPTPKAKPTEEKQENKGIISKEAMEEALAKVRERDKILAELIGNVDYDKTKAYLLSRIFPQITWYNDKSVENKKKHLFWMTVSIILGALIPVASVFSSAPLPFKILIAALGTSVTAVNAYMSLNSYKDLWLSYRATSEDLQRTMYAFFAGTDFFSGKSPEEKNACLVEACEARLSHESSRWIGLWQSPASINGESAPEKK